MRVPMALTRVSARNAYIDLVFLWVRVESVRSEFFLKFPFFSQASGASSSYPDAPPTYIAAQRQQPYNVAYGSRNAAADPHDIVAGNHLLFPHP